MFKIIIFLISISFLFACNSGNKKNTDVVYSNSELSNFKDYSKKVSHYSKTVKDVSILFKIVEAPFIKGLTNNPKEYSKYTKSKELLAINIGVYWIDALYLYSYNKKDSALASTNAVINLAKELNIDKVFKEFIEDRYLNNEIIDSFFIKLDSCFINEKYILQEDDRMRIYTSMLIGKYVETQYILFNVIFNYPPMSNDVKYTMLQDLLVVMGNNMESTDELISLMNNYKTTDDIGLLHKNMNEFAINYKKLKSDIKTKKITPNTFFDNETLKNMYKQITSIHNYITK